MRSLLFSLFAIFIAFTTIATGSANAEPNIKPATNIDKFEKQIDAIGNAFDDLEKVAKSLDENNPRAKELNEKAKKGKLTPAEEKEFDAIIAKSFEETYSKKEQQAKINKSDYYLLSFDDPRCAKCQALSSVFKEVAKKHSIGLVLINPKDFKDYVTRYDLSNDLLAPFVVDLYSDPQRLNLLASQGQMGILLHDRKSKLTYTIGNTIDFNKEDKEKLSAIISMTLRLISDINN